MSNYLLFRTTTFSCYLTYSSHTLLVLVVMLNQMQNGLLEAFSTKEKQVFDKVMTELKAM